MKHCPQCNAELPDGARFCLHCGEKQDGSQKDKAHLEGSGAIAQGEGAKAVGQNGILIDGNVETQLVAILLGAIRPSTFIREVTKAKPLVQQKKNAIFIVNM